MEESNASSKFKRICVFCGSNSGHRQVFSDAALELGNELVCLFVCFLTPSKSFFASVSCCQVLVKWFKYVILA